MSVIQYLQVNSHILDTHADRRKAKNINTYNFGTHLVPPEKAEGVWV
jgi:hypothetical protein